MQLRQLGRLARLPLAVALALAVGAGGAWSASNSGIRGQISALDDDLVRLTDEQKTRQSKLDQLVADVDAERQKLAEVQADVAFEKCQAGLARLQSQAAVLQAQCLVAYAGAAACEAHREELRARREIFGGLLGLGLATFTGGISLLAAGAAGAAAGGIAPNGSCAEPECDFHADAIKAEVLSNNGLIKVPTCKRSRASR